MEAPNSSSVEDQVYAEYEEGDPFGTINPDGFYEESLTLEAWIVNCMICQSPVESNTVKGIKIEECKHIFHTSCATTHLETDLSLGKVPLACPCTGCGTPLAFFEVQRLQGKGRFAEYRAVLTQQEFQQKGQKSED